MTITVLASTKSLVDTHADVSAVLTVDAAVDAVASGSVLTFDGVFEGALTFDGAIGGALGDATVDDDRSKGAEDAREDGENDRGGGWFIGVG
jgi:hypothetical protein